MPPYTELQITTLKREMRAAETDGYRLADAAVGRLMAETGLTAEQIRMWVKDVLAYYKTEERRKAFFKNERDQSLSRKARRIYIVAWIHETQLDLFLASGTLKIEYLEYARCNTTGECEMFTQLENPVILNTILRVLKQAGFSSISWHTYANDGSDQAARSLLRISTLSKTAEYTHGVMGSQKQYLASTLKTVSKKKMVEKVVSDEHDVVKKRKQMETAISSEQDQFTTEGFSHFLGFERHTKLALLRAIQADDVKTRTMELKSHKEMYESGAAAEPKDNGGVYLAKSLDIDAIKIGATLRADPQIRLNELTRFVSSPFQLVLWIPTTDPFTLEKKIHRQFDDARVRVPGVSTEFFVTEAHHIVDYLKPISEGIQTAPGTLMPTTTSAPATLACVRTHVLPPKTLSSAEAASKQRGSAFKKPHMQAYTPDVARTDPHARPLPGLAAAAASLTYAPQRGWK